MEKKSTLERTTTLPIFRMNNEKGNVHTEVGRRKTVSFQKKNHVYDVIPEMPRKNQTPLKPMQLRQLTSSDMYALPPGPSQSDNHRPSLNNCLSPVYVAPPLLQLDQKGAPPPEMNHKEVDVSSNVHYLLY